MLRLAIAAALALAACGTTEDDRPATLEYVTAAILTPSCGNAQCHSSFRQEQGYAFGTVEEARDSLLGLVVVEGPDAGNPDESFLIEVMTRTIDRMPRDRPVPTADLELLRRWIERGAKGAQCAPNDGAEQCLDDKLLYECGDDYSYGAVIEDCSMRPPSMAGRRWGCRANACVEVAP